MQAAKRAGKSSVEIDGKTFLCHDVRPHFVTATFNPGYAGRTKLPPSNAFRTMNYSIPQRELIIDVKLASFGFNNTRVQGKLINDCIESCRTQLLPTDHYDFGLRKVYAICVLLQKLKKKDPQADEMSLIAKAFDMNIKPMLTPRDNLNYQSIVVKYGLQMSVVN